MKTGNELFIKIFKFSIPLKEKTKEDINDNEYSKKTRSKNIYSGTKQQFSIKEKTSD
jgi:hypothetical protein